MEFDSFVLAASTADLGEEPDARGDADAVEFRMDLADEPLEELASYGGDLPVIATNRASWEGGQAPEEGRLDALSRAAEHPAVAAVDVELESLGTEAGEATADHASAHGVAVVASVHDFESTPPVDRLRTLLGEAATAGDVGKLAVTAHELDDALAVLTATHQATRAGERVATMAMGEAGRHTRAVAPLYGSRIGYAPVDPSRATAPGQYSLSRLRSLVSSLSPNPEA